MAGDFGYMGRPSTLSNSWPIPSLGVLGGMDLPLPNLGKKYKYILAEDDTLPTLAPNPISVPSVRVHKKRKIEVS